MPSVTIVRAHHLIQLPKRPPPVPVNRSRRPLMIVCSVRHRYCMQIAHGRARPRVHRVRRVAPIPTRRYEPAPPSNLKLASGRPVFTTTVGPTATEVGAGHVCGGIGAGKSFDMSLVSRVGAATDPHVLLAGCQDGRKPTSQRGALMMTKQ